MESINDYFHLTKLQNFLKFPTVLQRNHFSIIKEIYNDGSLVRLVKYIYDNEEYVMKSVPISRFEPKKWKNIRREIEITLHLKHAHILETYGYFVHCDTMYCIMEYAPRGTLFEIRNIFVEDEIKAIANQLLHGLAYLHQNNIIHRDIKLENTFLFPDGRVKIGDFDHSINHKKEIAKTLLGTTDYISPETLSNIENNPFSNEKITFSTDIWALGILVYELYNGKAPFTSAHPADTVQRIITENPAQLKCSNEMSNFLYHCLQKNPRNRPSALKLIEHQWVQRINTNPKEPTYQELQTYFIKKQMNFYKVKTRKTILMLDPKVLFLSSSDVMTNVFYSFIEPKGYTRCEVENKPSIIVIDYNIFNKNEKWAKFDAFKIALVTIHPDTATELLSDDFDAYMAKPLTKSEIDSIFPTRLKKVASKSF